MTQNRINVGYTPDALSNIDTALGMLDYELRELIALTPEERRDLFKMGKKSEAFCSTALRVAEQHTGVMPRDFDLAGFQRDHAALEALRPRALRLAQLAQRLADSELALGSDLMAASLEVYGVVKVVGKDKGLDEARRNLAARFVRSTASDKPEGELPTG